jgi:hypothetical protein
MREFLEFSGVEWVRREEWREGKEWRVGGSPISRAREAAR